MSIEEQFCESCGAANPAEARFCQFCAAPLPFKHTTGTLPEQTLLNGRYQLEFRIGQGGMGAVYKASDTRFNNRPIAIKEMSRAGLTGSSIKEAEESFEREAQLLAELLHPNLPRIYDHFNEGERSYLVMDFIEGESLEDTLEKANGGPLELERVLNWAKQLCDVLSYLHNHQPPIIFRDLKPSNVMISGNGHIYLIDFGIARVFKPGQAHDTIALGSPGYAAPEQYGKAQSTPRSDIYSLGALLHQLLTGVDPSDQPFFFKPASELNPQVPQELSDLLQQMLNMDSALRPESAEVVLETIRRIEQQQVSGETYGLSAINTPRSIPVSNPVVVTRTRQPETDRLLQDAYRLYSERRIKEALEAYDRLIQVDGSNVQAWQGRGLTLAMWGRHQEALQAFERALQVDPNFVGALNSKGAALNRLRRNQEALDAFDKAILLDRANAVAWNGKGAALSALGRHEQALHAFDQALQYDPSMALAWANKSLVLRHLKRYQEALDAAEKALNYDSNAAANWNNKGLILYEMGRLKEASVAYQEALRHDSRFAPAYYGMGNVLYAQQRLKSALEQYEQALQFDPYYVKVWERKGQIHYEMGAYARALSAFDRALQLDRNYALAWNGKANVLSHLGRYQEALAAYDEALRLNPNAAATWNGKGNVLYRLNQYRQALDAYDRALILNPRMVSALHNKSLILKLMGRYGEALIAADEAIRLAPNDPDNWLRKAEALRKLYRRREARAAEEEAARLRGGM
ncbi:serine/threonine protein kinase [Thermosporothrix hazakensis]|uniref:Serine/threonine protein kinase n=2 Tax=Thermosporothrix TaxID=768650 RepID=A0A326TZJ9_THEHA|nr:serine/threonine-protein kinase [Thermosporothrix hazakensis]PZW22200.1 serine/threonine protein kinase [Thermosporothrix hazakensis]BBH89881.1 hypothetical protein KTC_46320 [Thermosporothrix sp. COM3]GCE48077.1 hypothetical protein KTH_29460 [Thermosporothrix hazakensis]